MMRRLAAPAASASYSRALLSTTTTTTTTTPAAPSSAPSTYNLKRELFQLGRSASPNKQQQASVSVQQRTSKATQLIEHFSSNARQLNVIKPQDLVACLDSIGFCQLSLKLNYTPLVDAIVNELLSRRGGQIAPVLFSSSADAGKLSRVLTKYASSSVLKQLDARVAEDFAHMENSAVAVKLGYAHYELMLRLGEQSKRALLSSPSERHVVDLATNHLAKLQASPAQFAANLAVEAMALCPPASEDVNGALQSLLSVALDKLVAPGDNTDAAVHTKWVFHLFESNNRRRKLDEEWPVKLFKTKLAEALLQDDGFRFQVSRTKQSDFDLGTISLALWSHAPYWAQFPGIPAFASELVQDVAARFLQQQQQQQPTRNLPAVPYYLNHLPADVLSPTCAASANALQQIGDVLADRLLLSQEKQQLGTAQLERALWDMERSAKLDAVFSQVVFPHFASSSGNGPWDERSLRVLLKFTGTPKSALVALLLEHASSTSKPLPLKVFEMFQDKLGDSSGIPAELQAVLDANYLRSAPATPAQTAKLSAVDVLRLAKLFASNSECRDKLWREVVLPAAKHLTTASPGGAQPEFAEAVRALGKDKKYEEDAAFQALPADKQREFAQAVRGGGGGAGVGGTSVDREAEDLARAANSSDATENELVRATDELVARLKTYKEQGGRMASRSVSGAICSRLEKKHDDPATAGAFAPAVLAVLDRFDAAFLCRLAGSAPTRELRDACIDRVHAALSSSSSTLNALDALFAFNNALPRFLDSSSASTEALAKEQFVVNELAAHILDASNLAQLPVKLLVNALKTLQRVDEAFPEFKIEFRDALLGRLAQTISQRAASEPTSSSNRQNDDLVRVSNILAHFKLDAAARAIAEQHLLLVSGNNSASSKPLSATKLLDLAVAEDVVVGKYALQSFTDVEAVLAALPASARVKAWVCAHCTDKLDLNLADQMHVAEWLAVNNNNTGSEEGESGSGEQQQEVSAFLAHFAQSVEQRAGRVEEPKLNAVDLLATLLELSSGADSHPQVVALALRDIVQDLPFYVKQASKEDQAALETVLQELRDVPQFEREVKQIDDYVVAQQQQA